MMQKIKRKSGEGDVPPSKKKKVQFTDSDKNKNSDNAKTEKTRKPDNEGAKGLKTAIKKKIKKVRPAAGGKPLKKFDKAKTSFTKVKKIGKEGQNSGEKPQWSEMRKEKKQLRIVRRKSKTSAEVFLIANKAKLLAAQIQRKVVKPEFRLALCNELHLLMKGQYKAIALTHDLSRVIQVLLKHSPEETRNEITTELLTLMVPMLQSKYANHSVKRILKYGSEKIRHQVIEKLFGNIVSLASHTISAPVLDYAYTEFANKKEKAHMQQEFYGDIYKNAKDDKVRTLTDTYKDSPEMKTAFLQSCKSNIQRILDKNLHDGELLHSVLYDYLRACGAEERTEMVSTLAPLVVPLSNSLPGVNAASICVWQGTNKDKKTILKVVKEHAVSLSKHKSGYRLLLAIFDSVDDTVLVRKAVVAALLPHARDLAKDHWGNMTLHWLIKPKDPVTFHPNLIRFLEEGFRSGSSKKDPELRVSELRDAILPKLVKDIAADPYFWISDKDVMLLAIAVVSVDPSPELVSSLARAVCQESWTVARGGKAMPAIEDAGLHVCLKKLAALDKDREKSSFGDAVSEFLTHDVIRTWVTTNRGCFFLLKLLESNSDVVGKKLRKKLKPHSDTLRAQQTEGSKLLLLLIRTWVTTNRGCFFLLKLLESNSDVVGKKLRKKLKPHSDTLRAQQTEGSKLLLLLVHKK